MRQDIASYGCRHSDLIYQAPALYRLLTHLLDDPNLPKKLRPLILAAIAYFILPLDIIQEDLEGPYRYVDDIWLCAFVANRVRQELGSDQILVDSWDGEGRIIGLLEDVLSKEKSLMGNKSKAVLEHIGYSTGASDQID